MNKSAKLGSALAGAMLYAFASPAAAEDTATTTKKKSDGEAAAQTLPTWESYGAGEPETAEETFFRLSRDFVTTSDLSTARLGAVPIWPRGELKVLGVRILPYLREAIEWQDNYYKQPNSGITRRQQHGRDAVYTHINEAGVLADTALMGGRLTLATSLNSTWNLRYGSSAPPDTWDFDGQVGATYKALSGVWVAGGLTYTRRHDSADLEPLASDFGRTRRGAFLKMGFDKDIFFRSRLKFEFGVQTDDHAAVDEAYDTLNRTETIFYGKASYPFLKDTTRIFVLVRDRITNKDSERLNDGNTWGVNVGLEGSIPLREGEYRGIRGQVSVGFDTSLYDDGTFRSGSQTLVADDDRKTDNANVQVALQYIMSPKTTVELRYLHQTQFSFRGNEQVVDHVELTMSHNFTRQLSGRVQGYAEHIDPTGNTPNQSIPSNTLASSSNNVNRVGFGFGFRYAINEWMDVDVDGSIENRNDHDNSYKNYKATLGLTFYLNAIIPKPRATASR